MMIHDSEKEKFKNQLPCVTCQFAKICKYAFSMEPINIPDVFRVTITCNEQENLMKPHKKGVSNE